MNAEFNRHTTANKSAEDIAKRVLGGALDESGLGDLLTGHSYILDRGRKIYFDILANRDDKVGSCFMAYVSKKGKSSIRFEFQSAFGLITVAKVVIGRATTISDITPYEITRAKNALTKQLIALNKKGRLPYKTKTLSQMWEDTLQTVASWNPFKPKARSGHRTSEAVPTGQSHSHQ